MEKEAFEFADFFENASIGLHLVGADGRIIRVNQAELDALGYSQSEYVGHHIAEFHVDQDKIDDILRRLLNGETLHEYRACMRCKDGSVKHVLIDSSGHWEDGKFIHSRCFTRDITEQKKAEDALKESDRRKDEFLAMLAHELRNPLAPIRTAAQVVLEYSENLPEMRLAAEVIERQVRQMARLVDDLLDVSRITRGKIELRREYTSLIDIVTSAVEASQPLIAKRGHKLVTTLPEGAIWLDADPARLSQVLTNLLNNAAKYTNESGQISLSVRRHKSDVEIRVKDSGIGIPPEKIANVFDMFTQLDRSLVRAEGGLGIGLTLVRDLVELHGGTVRVLSAGVDLGSEFIVLLPMAVVDRLPEAAHNPVAKSANASGKRVLIVDDNHDAAKTLAMVLGLSGFETRVASDGIEAIDLAEQFRPHAMLLDIGLPSMNGHQVAGEIRTKAWGADVFLIALTGWGQDEDRKRSTEAGFNAHFVKPADHAELMKLLVSI